MTKIEQILKKYNFQKRIENEEINFEIVEKEINFRLPEDYKFYVTNYIGNEFFIGNEFVKLWDFNELLEINNDYEITKKILELNPSHPILKNLIELDSDSSLKTIVIEQILDSALLVEGLHPDPSSMVQRVQEIMQVALLKK